MHQHQLQLEIIKFFNIKLLFLIWIDLVIDNLINKNSGDCMTILCVLTKTPVKQFSNLKPHTGSEKCNNLFRIDLYCNLNQMVIIK